MDYNSKYTGAQVEEMLDQIANGEIGGGGGIAVETDPIFSASPAASITEEKKAEWDDKQEKITDLDAIRSGAAAGATALQSVPSEYITEATLNNKGYLTSVPDEYVTETELNGKGYATTSELTIGLSEKASIAQVESMIAEAITNTLNTEV